MTEAGWLECDNPTLIFNYLFRTPEASDRKVRLVACACCRSVWHLLPDERSRRAVEVTEAHADGAATDAQLAQARADATVAWANARRWAGQLAPGPERQSAALEADALQLAVWLTRERATERDQQWIATLTVLARQALTSVLPGSIKERHEERARERRQSCGLLREIFGNPFRPVAFAPAWRTPDVARLAAAVYHDRAFDLLPILGDALEEAGCADTAVLDHCRSPGPHARGCWALDLALGKC